MRKGLINYFKDAKVTLDFKCWKNTKKEVIHVNFLYHKRKTSASCCRTINSDTRI